MLKKTTVRCVNRAAFALHIMELCATFNYARYASIYRYLALELSAYLSEHFFVFGAYWNEQKGPFILSTRTRGQPAYLEHIISCPAGSVSQ